MMVQHSTVVFLGPSLDQQGARELLAADYFPPARKGDIYRIMASGVKTIVLVDGVFHNTPSVWPREILNALEEGIEVIGAASMGALRAAELYEFGMLGCGTIFEWYRDGLIDADDEVAVSHASAEFGFRPLSEALVNIRFTLDRAIEDLSLSHEQARQLLDYAKQLHYPERSYQKLLNSEVVNCWPEQRRAMLRDYVRTRAVNLKMRDAIGALRHAARKSRSRYMVAPGAYHSGEHLWQVERLRLNGFVRAEDIVTGETVLQVAQKDPELLSSMRRKLSQRCFVLEWTRQNKISLEDQFLANYIERWEERYRIDAKGDWLGANGLTGKFYKELLSECALVDWIVANGPARFGIVWDFDQALRREHRMTGRILEADLEVPERPIIETPLLDREQKEPAAQLWIDLSYRCFLLEWARQNGISCPSDRLQAYRGEWDRKQLGNHRGIPKPNDSQSLAEYSAFIEESALVDWITSQGPNHFGILWAFEEALLRELQVTGRAAILLQQGQPSCGRI